MIYVVRFCSTNSICVFITYFDINNTDAINDGVYGGDIEDSSSQVRVTDIDYRSGGFVRGTFSGTLVNEDTGETINITDGEFNVAIQ